MTWPVHGSVTRPKAWRQALWPRAAAHAGQLLAWLLVATAAVGAAAVVAAAGGPGDRLDAADEAAAWAVLCLWSDCADDGAEADELVDLDGPGAPPGPDTRPR